MKLPVTFYVVPKEPMSYSMLSFLFNGTVTITIGENKVFVKSKAKWERFVNFGDKYVIYKSAFRSE